MISFEIVKIAALLRIFNVT